MHYGPLGMQCGVFTQSLPLAMQAFRSIRTGGVIINGSSTWRTDQLAYGEVKNSGIGCEGPRYAIRDLTKERLLVLNLREAVAACGSETEGGIVLA